MSTYIHTIKVLNGNTTVFASPMSAINIHSIIRETPTRGRIENSVLITPGKMALAHDFKILNIDFVINANRFFEWTREKLD